MARILIGFLSLATVFVGTLAGMEHANSSLAQKNPLCDACVDVTEKVQKDITTNVIDKFLTGICDLTGGGIVKKECSKLMSALEKKIDIHFDAQKECDQFMMCGKWSDVVVKIAQEAEDGTKEAEKLIDEILTKAVDKIIKLDPLKLEISALCKLCEAIVNATDKDVKPVECVKYLNQAIEKWWGEIFNTPEKVCTFLHLCSTDSR